MPQIRHTTGERWYSGRFGGVAFHRRETKDVDEEVADWLVTLDEFKRVDDADSDTGTDADGGTAGNETPTVEAELGDEDIDGSLKG